jgi:hypothetical protein
MFLIGFSHRQKFITNDQHHALFEKSQIIYSMLWGMLRPR